MEVMVIVELKLVMEFDPLLYGVGVKLLVRWYKNPDRSYSKLVLKCAYCKA